jgi:hypothetical protein
LGLDLEELGVDAVRQGLTRGHGRQADPHAAAAEIVDGEGAADGQAAGEPGALVHDDAAEAGEDLGHGDLLGGQTAGQPQLQLHEAPGVLEGDGRDGLGGQGGARGGGEEGHQ